MDHIEYIFFAQFSIAFVFTLVFFITWRFIERKPHTFFWFLAFIATMINMMTNAAKPLFPDRDIYWIFVNLTSLLMQGLSLAGFRSRSGLKPITTKILAYFIVVELLVIVFTVIYPHMGLKMFFIPFSGALTMLASIWAIKQFNEKLCHAEWGAIAMIGFHAIMQCVSGVIALFQGQFAQEPYLSLYSNMNFLLMPAVFVGVGTFISLIIANDLAMRMKNLAMTDQLTKLFNRRGFELTTEQSLAKAQRKKTQLCVVMADIDHFKSINDKYGHAAGDQALMFFAKLLRKELRRTDIIGRLGGEEFAILLEDTSGQECQDLFERVKARLAANTVKTTDGEFIMTASFGIALTHHSHQTIEPALKVADSALYQAKTTGRNRVVIV